MADSNRLGRDEKRKMVPISREKPTPGSEESAAAGNAEESETVKALIGDFDYALDRLQIAPSAVQRLAPLRAATIALCSLEIEKGEWKSALAGLGRLEAQVAMEHKLAEGDREGAPTRLAESREWQDMKATILEALRPYPEAFTAVLGAITHDPV